VSCRRCQAHPGYGQVHHASWAQLLLCRSWHAGEVAFLCRAARCQLQLTGSTFPLRKSMCAHFLSHPGVTSCCTEAERGQLQRGQGPGLPDLFC
jgi:hypothetical protein